MLASARRGATFLLNTPYPDRRGLGPAAAEVQQRIIDKKMKFYVINAYEVAKETGMGGRINTIMQTCFFYLSGILPQDEAIAEIKGAIKKTYGKRGDKIVQKNYKAVDRPSPAPARRSTVPGQATSTFVKPPVGPDEAPEFVQNVTATIMAGEGDKLPVSAMPADGTWPTGTTQWEKRNIALEIPVWDPEICIQCGKCSIVCPHADHPHEGLRSGPAGRRPGDVQVRRRQGQGVRGHEVDHPGGPGRLHRLRRLRPRLPGQEQDRTQQQGHQHGLPAAAARGRAGELRVLPGAARPGPRRSCNMRTVKGSQLCRPLFEYSGACAGCGETPYVKLLTQLFGDRALIGNATGCSSIYGGNLPTTPYCTNADGRGPAWNNSLFEDAAEFATASA